MVEGGVDALLIENYGDKPYLERVCPETIVSMTVLAREIKREISIPLGINVLRNDWRAGLSIASILKLDFVRINIVSGLYLTETGVITGDPRGIAELRRKLSFSGTPEIYSDVLVKHSLPLYPRDLEEAILDLSERCGFVDALILTGRRTGEPPMKEELAKALEISELPVFVGSGVTPERVKEFKDADGVIVGTYLKEGEEVSIERVREIRRAIDSLSK